MYIHLCDHCRQVNGRLRLQSLLSLLSVFHVSTCVYVAATVDIFTLAYVIVKF